MRYGAGRLQDRSARNSGPGLSRAGGSRFSGPTSSTSLERQSLARDRRVFGLKTRDALVSLIHASIDSHLHKSDSSATLTAGIFRTRLRRTAASISADRRRAKLGEGERTAAFWPREVSTSVSLLPWREHPSASKRLARRPHADSQAADAPDDDNERGPSENVGAWLDESTSARSWYNNEWLARTLAIGETLWTEEGSSALATSSSTAGQFC